MASGLDERMNAALQIELSPSSGGALTPKSEVSSVRKAV